MTSTSCVACGRPHPGPVPADSIAAITAPRMRATLGGHRERLCLVCQWNAYNAQVWAVRRTGREMFGVSFGAGAR